MLYTHLLWVAASVAVLVAVKSPVLYGLARVYGVRSSERDAVCGSAEPGETRTTVQPRSGRSAPVYCCNFEQLLAPWMARRPIPCPFIAIPPGHGTCPSALMHSPCGTTLFGAPPFGGRDFNFLGRGRPHIHRKQRCRGRQLHRSDVVLPVFGVRYEHLPPHRQDALACQE